MIHPFRFYRTHLKLSQADMASRIASSDAAILSLTNSNTGTISTQYYRRLEKGMVNPGTNWDAVLDVFHRSALDILGVDCKDWHELRNKYTNMLILEGDELLVESPLYVEALAPSFENQLFDWYLLTRLKVRRKLEKGGINYLLMNAKPVEIRKRVTSVFNLPDTDYSFSLIMGLHIFSVQQWTKENTADTVKWPRPIVRALMEVGGL